MMNGHDYRRDRSDRDYYDEPRYRSWGEVHEEPYYHGHDRSYYDLSHRGWGHGGYYDEPYSDTITAITNTATALANLITGAALRGIP
jgi:hypothetical protein